MQEEKKFELDVITRLTKIETMLEDFKGIENKSTQAYNLSLNNKMRLDKIEDKNQWAFRTSVGAIIASVVGAIISLIVALIK